MYRSVLVPSYKSTRQRSFVSGHRTGSVRPIDLQRQRVYLMVFTRATLC